MVRTGSLYDACQELFSDYPQAITVVNPGKTVRAMVMLVRGGAYSGFFALVQDRSGGESSYLLWAWPAGDIFVITAEDRAGVPDVAAEVIMRGLPIPRDGSVFGWTFEGVVTALIVVYSEYTHEHPVPGWAVMPLAGAPEEQWPPFTGKALFGDWSWEQYRTGRLLALDELIAETPETVFWADTRETLGSACCAVAADIRTPEGVTLRRGCYVYYEALRTAKPIPSLETLLSCEGKTDLAPRFSDRAA